METLSPEQKKVHDEDLQKKDETSPEPFIDRMGFKGRKLLCESQVYKQPRMNMLAIYERLYNNDVPPKFRSMFNVVLPIFSGMVDELLAMFNDQVMLKFNAKNPAQYLIVPKIQAQWEAERDSVAPTAKWNYKTRTDRFNAVLSGRGIFREYAYNEPSYTNVLEVINYSDFHCQPLGGGNLDNHNFKGTEGNFISEFDLKSSSKFDQKQVEKLLAKYPTNEDFTRLETSYGTRFARWKALGFNPETNSFGSERTYNMCDFMIKEAGVWYNVVFEPCTGVAVYCEEWEGVDPYCSYATHEDDKNFWSKGFADDFFPIADSVIILFNQELTNREKKNYNARAFDKQMFPDYAKFDAAQYRPDSSIPADTMGGAKKIADGIYTFTTPELQGTINLIDWMSTYTGNKTGAEELPPKGGAAKAAVAIQFQQKQSKRVGLRSDSWKECYTKLGIIFIEGMRDYMPTSVSVQVVGENGFTEQQELKRIEIKKNGLPGVSVTSTSEQEGSDAMKRDGQINAIELVAKNPTLSRYEKETIYRNVGQFDENEIALLLDTKGELSKKQLGHASQNIQDVLLGREPDIYYGADVAYLNYLTTYIEDHKSHVMGKEEKFLALINTMTPIVQENTKRLAAKVAAQTPPAPAPNGQDKSKTPTGTPEAVADRMGKAMA